MKRLFLFISSIFLGSVIALGEESVLKPESRIDSVCVYTDRALVTRTASLELGVGSYEVVFEGLPAGIAEDSVRVSGVGTAASRIFGTEVRKTFLERPQQERIRQLEDEILKLRDEDKALSDAMDNLQFQKKFIHSIEVATAENISKDMTVTRPTVEDWQNILNFLGRSLSQIDEGLRKLEVQRREIKAKLDAKQRELNQVQQYKKLEQRSVSVDLEIAKAGRLDLSISYVIMGAGWNPLYDVRLSPEDKAVEVTYYGAVWQRTGEDWEEVSLTLSTAKPALGAKVPELSPWIVDIYVPRPRPPAPAATAPAPGAKRAVPPPEALKEEAGAEEELALAEVVTSEVERKGGAVTFGIRKRESVPSDGSPHRTTIAVERFDAPLEYISVPKVMEYAYLTSKVVNRADYSLLGGRANVFLGSDFLGASTIPTVAPGEAFDLSLGVDEDLKVKREVVSRETGTSGLLGNQVRIKHAYRITLENYKKGPQTVSVVEQIPVSRSAEIKVEVSKVDPPISERKDDGRIIWKLSLRAGERKEIYFEFHVDHPKDKEITGL
ncbi:MAG: mucoidy inhibitor MuiA family protein [bacterium]